ncbi:hypothetical protein OEA41_000782 [Lepraria neglecta]|uniref:Laccase n=1 Tax=Lepraria neglecta TaxID=209136 RepID=A0AAE0DQ42_9LECA|nr:hypothetical protein OEA41_000782 [Lepraria neglecta]
MHVDHVFWGSLTYVLNIFSLSPVHGPVIEDQAPLALHPVEADLAQKPGPIFKPPSGTLDGSDSNFVCDYSAMVGYEFCSTPDYRSCWLNHTTTGHQFNMTTDYETEKPIGIHRYYELDITDDTSINADGVDFDAAKLFNRQYPGPWLQACWGDTVSVKINNWMKSNGGNGTSIHWHGVRQLNSMHMDGVNGLSQCPIAPGDSFNYTWEVMQYGSSWYHSHYSVQYADGLLGPLTLHGPTILPYDEAIDPILMTEWGHSSAFEAIQLGTPGTPSASNEPFKNPSILLNGRGNATQFNSITTPLHETHDIPTPYTIRFHPKPTNGRPKSYLLRLINTSMASTFIFSIDNHYLHIVGADFVPVMPYRRESILVAIGQRYHVIVEADPQDPKSADGNYWIRTIEANCTDFAPTGEKNYERTGILRYNDSTNLPQSEPWLINATCTDEDWDNLTPVVKWEVGPPANGEFGENLTVIFKQNSSLFPLAFASIGGDTFNPMYLDYSKPTFLNLNYPGAWDPRLVVFKENYTNTSWVYFNIKNGRKHPIHLHGHDFAIIKNGSSDFQLKNPPRRDVLLPAAGGEDTIIAFKLDNPGTWLMHCHIAFHASWGLAMQFLERQDAAIALWPSFEKSPALVESQRVCDNWNRWWGDCRDWWPGDGKSCGIGEEGFAPDSGI